MHLEGTPSDQLPEVLATGQTDITYSFFSLSARDPDGRDAAYIAWHWLDHRPEQYRIEGLRNAIRLTSTPACRAARAANEKPFDAVDHIMTYQFKDDSSIPAFNDLGGALHRGGRMPHRLPSLGYLTGDVIGKAAAARAVAGADVIPWRPAHGVYFVVEEGEASAANLVDLPGVAGVWWFRGTKTHERYSGDSSGRQITYCFLDEDPVAVAPKLGDAMKQRWASGKVKGLFAAPFYVSRAFEWDRYLP